MGDVVNLNRFRKAKEKRCAKRRAANRPGTAAPKEQRAREKDEAARAAKDLDSKKIDDPV